MKERLWVSERRRKRVGMDILLEVRGRDTVSLQFSSEDCSIFGGLYLVDVIVIEQNGVCAR